MRTAETVLNIIRERGQQGRPLERLYRHLYNRDLYLRAYGNSRNRLLESDVTRKSVTRRSEGGRWKRAGQPVPRWRPTIPHDGFLGEDGAAMPCPYPTYPIS